MTAASRNPETGSCCAGAGESSGIPAAASSETAPSSSLLRRWIARGRCRSSWATATVTGTGTGSAEEDKKKTLRFIRYGIGLVCIGVALNWVGYFEGPGFVDPFRYVGFACVIGGCVSVCLAMCGRIGAEDSITNRTNCDGTSGGIHAIFAMSALQNSPLADAPKPPDYDDTLAEPPPYEEAIKFANNGPNSPNLKFDTCGLPIFRQIWLGDEVMAREQLANFDEFPQFPPPAYSGVGSACEIESDSVVLPEGWWSKNDNLANYQLQNIPDFGFLDERYKSVQNIGNFDSVV